MENLPVPMSRIDCYLATAAGMAGVTLPAQPESRLELFLAYIAGDTSVELPTPLSLTELWLGFVAGVQPKTDEMKLEGACYIGPQKVDVRFFAVAGGLAGVTAPDPQNRTEQYWANIQGGGGGVLKYATGTYIALTDVVRGISSLENIYGNTTQDGTPTPDAPVNVNVVTGEQSVWVHGKNLANPTIGATAGSNNTTLTNIPGGIRAAYNGASGTSSRYRTYIVCEATQLVGKYLTMRAIFDGNKGGYTFGYCDADVSNHVRLPSSSNTDSGIDTTAIVPQVATGKYIYLQFAANRSNAQTGDYTDYTNIQLEIGQSSTTYEPYTSATYPVNLGSTELCKIGDYQDYIYKSGNDWYLHKEVYGREVTAISNLYSSAGSGFIGAYVGYSTLKANSRDNGFCDKLVPIYSPNGATTEGITFGAGSTSQNVYIILKDSRVTPNTIPDWNTYLSNNPYFVYYPIDPPTDTKITDATLISQLNAVGSAVLPKPNAYIEVSPTGTNLAGSLKISYYGESE